MTAPWIDGEELTAAVMYARITQRIDPLPKGYVGSSSSTSSLTLSTTSSFAGLAVITFTITAQRRIKITVQTRFVPAAATTGRYAVTAGYNAGGSALIGSFVSTLPAGFAVPADATSNQRSGHSVTTELLAAGTYTAYASVIRTNGGSATDVVNSFYTLVEDIGSS